MHPQVSATLSALEAAANPARAAACLRERPTAERLLGMPVPVYREIALGLGRQLAGSPPAEALQLALALRATGVHEARLVAYELLGAQRDSSPLLDRPTLEALGQGLDNWVSVDTFGVLLSGRALREGRITEPDLLDWARSPDRWWRRAALVSTIGWNLRSRGGRGEVPGTLRVCAALVDDRDEMVVKALSWALRELAPWGPEALRAFLEAHGDRVPARARRELLTKLNTGTKRGISQAKR